MPAELTAPRLQQDNRFQRLRAAIELAVGDICSEVSTNTGVKISPEVAATIAELTVDKSQRTAQDLEAFAQHAKRSNVTGEDVKLLTRRNPKLTQHLASLQRDQPAKGRPTGSKSSKARGKPRDESQGGGVAGGSGLGAGRPLID